MARQPQTQRPEGWILHLSTLNIGSEGTEKLLGGKLGLGTCSRQLVGLCSTWKPPEHPRNPRKHHQKNEEGVDQGLALHVPSHPGTVLTRCPCVHPKMLAASWPREPKPGSGNTRAVLLCQY